MIAIEHVLSVPSADLRKVQMQYIDERSILFCRQKPCQIATFNNTAKFQLLIFIRIYSEIHVCEVRYINYYVIYLTFEEKFLGIGGQPFVIRLG